jgi:hypothetical protein
MMGRKTAAGAILFVAVMLALAIALCIQGHATTTSSRKNSLGVLAYERNPYVYVAGDAGEVFDIDNGAAINIRVNPIGTYQGFTEDLLFCGTKELELFQGKHNPIVLVFGAVAHRTVEGIGCHQLLRVEQIDPEKP